MIHHNFAANVDAVFSGVNIFGEKFYSDEFDSNQKTQEIPFNDPESAKEERVLSYLGIEFVCPEFLAAISRSNSV